MKCEGDIIHDAAMQREKCPKGWTWINGDDHAPRFERTDMAYVLRSKDEYYACPWKLGHRAWMAFVDVKRKDGDGIPLFYTRRDSKFHIARRWKTPGAAMRAVDRERPLAQKR